MTQNKLKLVTHDGSFHTDDIFAAATLSLYLEKEGKDFEIIRTRDPEIISSGDYVFDVGSVYDSDNNRFDHHQVGGAGKRTNGIEYASFGLVWKKFGRELCKNEKIAEVIDKRLASPVDALDNGINLIELKTDVMPYMIQSLFNSFNPGWRDSTKESLYQSFIECLPIAKRILINEIKRGEEVVEAEEAITEIYNNSGDKRILVIDQKYPWYDKVQSYPEPLFVVYPRVDGAWGVEGVAVAKYSMEKRKKFPKAWAGLRFDELPSISGVQDALFCHRALFMAVAKSKEGAIKLAQIALDSE